MNCLKISTFGTMLCLLGLGFSDTASGQTLTASPSALALTVLSGGATDTQTVNVTWSAGATTLYLNMAAAPGWLSVNGLTSGQTTYVNTASNGTEAFQVQVNTTGLTTGQVYTGNFTVQVNGVPSSLLTYTVTLTVGNPSLLSANPATLSFTAVAGATVGIPTSTAVTISSSGAQLSYTVSASTQSNSGNWLLLQNTTGTSNPSTAGFTVYVNPSLLTAGNTYNGTITVQSTTTSDSVTIPVTLSVTAGSVLNVTGTLNNFIYQFGSGQGGFTFQQQTLMISTSGSPLYYQVLATAGSNTAGVAPTANWLSTSTGGLANTTASPITLSLSSYANVASLPAGSYNINLAICPTGTSGCPANTNTTNVTVTLVVSNDALLNVSTTSLSFSIPFGTSTSQSKQINVNSSGASIPYTTGVAVSTTAQWLSVQPTGGGSTPGAFFIFVNASNLAVSSTPYVGTVTVYPNNADMGLYNIPITVSLTVTAATTSINAAPAALLFSDQTTMNAPGPQLVELTSTTSVGFTVASSVTPASNCPATNWLTWTESQATTPATLSISAATAGMTAGSCSGTVTVTYNGGGGSSNSTLIIPVTVNVGATPLLTVTPDFGFGVFNATSGAGTSISSRISVNSTDGSPLNFSASASTPGAPISWLFLGSSSGTTQQYIQVVVTPSGLPLGVYTGSIVIHATNSANLPSGDFTLPVTLTVSANTTISVTPTSLAFKQVQNATPPASQQISVTAVGGSTNYSAAVTPVTGGNWLSITQSSTIANSTPSTVTATVSQNTLSPGTYNSNIVLTFQNAATPTTTIPVTLTVSAAQTVTVAPVSLSFTYLLGTPTPPVQNLTVSSSGAAVNISTSTNVGWLVVTPPSGSAILGTPLVLGISLVPSALTTPQTYTGTITITPTTGQAPIIVPVTVVVSGMPVPQPLSISNSASGQFTSISPGELITIKGTFLGPATPATFTVASGGTVSSTLSGVQVLFDNIPGTPTYVSSNQINVIVPYEIAGRATTNVVVSYLQQPSAVIPQNVANQAPGIYTFSATGAGQAAVLNQNYSLNGPPNGLIINGNPINTTPAAAGSVIVVYMTGGGQTTPPSVTGTVTPNSPFYIIPLADVSATINGVNAPVQFAGAAPGEVTGVIQVNITVPQGVSGNAQPLVIKINGVASPFGPTVAIQ
jgi:trimeric autotransporter adhesin